MVNNEASVKMLMTTITDMYGQVVVIGEEVDGDEAAVWNLRHPIRVIPVEGGFRPAHLFAKEEWIRVPRAMAIEMQIHEKFVGMYVAAEQEIFGGGIILPKEKEIILQ